MNIEEIKAIAKKEVEEERFREAVDKEKEKLKKAKWYDKIFPWRLIIVRR